MVSEVPDKAHARKEITCIHCKNKQIVSEAGMKNVYQRLYCYSCNNRIIYEDYKDD